MSFFSNEKELITWSYLAWSSEPNIVELARANQDSHILLMKTSFSILRTRNGTRLQLSTSRAWSRCLGIFWWQPLDHNLVTNLYKPRQCNHDLENLHLGGRFVLVKQWGASLHQSQTRNLLSDTIIRRGGVMTSSKHNVYQQSKLKFVRCLVRVSLS